MASAYLWWSSSFSPVAFTFFWRKVSIVLSYVDLPDLRGWNSRMYFCDITSAIISVRSLKQFWPRISMKYGSLENLKGFEITISSSSFKSLFFDSSSSSFYFSLYFSNELFSSSLIEINEKQGKDVIVLFKDLVDLKSPKEFCKPKNKHSKH